MINSFGTNGVVDLKVGVVKGQEQQIDLETGEIGIHSTPTIARDMVIIGSSMREGATVSTHNNTKGLVRAFDVADRQEALAVRHDSAAWRSSATIRGRKSRGPTTATSVCGRRSPSTKSSASSTCPVETPTSDYYGGHRPGDNLFAESLVGVDLKTGQRKWHFQFVHHPLWNFDMSSAPLLADVTLTASRARSSRSRASSWLYVFDRVTGEPIWPIEEKPVPQGDVPGEVLADAAASSRSRCATRATSSRCPTI